MPVATKISPVAVEVRQSPTALYHCWFYAMQLLCHPLDELAGGDLDLSLWPPRPTNVGLVFKGSEIDDVGGLVGPGGFGNPFKEVGGKAAGKFSSVFGPTVAPRSLQTVRDLKMMKTCPKSAPETNSKAVS